MADAAFPESYQDPAYAAADSATTDKLGLPPGLLAAVRTRGERSNASATNSNGTMTPYQFIPATRDAILDKYGIDVKLSPQNASEGAGLLLKDSLASNGGSIPQAVAAYHGGTDPANWGPKTQAYVQRVTGAPLAAAPTPSPAPGQSTFDRVMAQMQGQQAQNSIASIYGAYQGGQMTPDERTQFEQDVQGGKIMLPQGASLQPAGAASDPNATGADQVAAGGTVPAGVLQAFARGQMSPQEMADFETDVRAGKLQLPPGMDQNALLGDPDKPLGVLDKIARIPAALHEAITGDLRRTPTTDALPNWTEMPELNQLSMASFKTGLGTISSDPQQTAQIIQANAPGVQVAQDEKGNYLLTSPTNGKTYAIKPGFGWGDIPRALGTAGTFVLANEILPGSGVRGLAANTAREAAVGAAGSGALEATKAATGGNFDVGNVATGAVLGAVAPTIGAVIKAGADALATPAQALLARVRGVEPPATPISVAADGAAPTNGATSPISDGAPISVDSEGVARTPAQQGAPSAPAGAPAATASVPPAAPPVAPSVQDIAQTARVAASGSKQATQDLAEMAAPDAKTSAAAQRLGIQDYLQPDHVTTSDAYRQVLGVMKSNPTSALALGEKGGLEQIGQRASSLIDEIGGSSDLSAVDANLKQAMRATHGDLSAQENRLYQEVRDGIPAQTPAPAQNTLAFLARRADDLGGAQNLSPMEKQALQKLTPIEGADGAVKQPTYTLLDDVRKDVGAAARQAGPFSDADTGLAKQLYARLSNDQQAVADATGQRYTFLAAKYATQLRKGMEDDMASIFGKQLQGSVVPELGGAMKAASKGDASRLVGLLQNVPDNLKQQVVASGMQTVFRNAATRGEINFTGYSKWYQGLMRNKQAYAAVMNNLPQPARKQLSDLYRVSKGISDSMQARIKTGLRSSVLDEMNAPDTLAQRMFDVAKHAGKGLAADAVGGHGAGLAMGLFSALKGGAKPNAVKAIDELLTSPEYLNLARNAGTPAQDNAVKALAVSKAFSKFSAAVGRVPAMSNRERWILAAMQSSNDLNSKTAAPRSKP